VKLGAVVVAAVAEAMVAGAAVADVDRRMLDGAALLQTGLAL
jgi:hypothetical protein